MDPQVAQAMTQAGATQAPAFQPPGGMGAPAPPPPPPPPPPTAPPDEAELVPAPDGLLSPDPEAEAEWARDDDARRDDLGYGQRPRRGSSMEHPLDRAVAQIGGELRGMASRLAGDLFPNGPAGAVQPTRRAMDGYVRRHWDDQTFRQSMLDRMAPKGPDGNRIPSGVRAFRDLYERAVAPYRAIAQAAAPMAPPPPPAGAPAASVQEVPPGGVVEASYQAQNPGMPAPRFQTPVASVGQEAGLPPPPGPNALPA